MIPQLREPVLGLLARRGAAFTFVDVGSRNGVLELADVAPFVDAYGFEPNPEEYAKLLDGTTDLEQLFGIAPPAYRSLVYLPCALADAPGRRGFYVTPGPGAAGLLEPDLDRLREIVWKGRRYVPNLGDEVFAGFSTIEVDVRTLDDIAAERGLGPIDYLKLDVEGSEYEVLAGAAGLLPSVGVVKAEVCFIPFRKGQKLFSHVDLLLRDAGFDLLRYEVQPAQVGYKEREGPVEYLYDFRLADPGAQALQADAVYVNRTVADPERALAQVTVLLELGYVDEATRILRTTARVEDPPLLALLRTVRHGGLGSRARLLSLRLVDRLARTLRVS